MAVKEIPKFREIVRQSGLKLTGPRERIAAMIFSARRHFSAEDLFEWLRKGNGKVSKATVYRTLHLLVEKGLVDEHDFGNGYKCYEHMVVRPHHDHLICLDCGKICEFQNPDIERLQNEVGKNFHFQITYHTHKLFGHCGDCSKRGRRK